MFPRYYVVWPGWIQINRERKDGFGYTNHSYPLNAKRVKWLQLPEGADQPPFNGKIIARGYSIGDNHGSSEDRT